ncbi:MAG: pyridoxamine 5'-phosphate oxidase family protein [Limnohabitans sp.]
MQITTPEQLRALYAAPTERAQRKQLTALDQHCRAFIALSPFVVLATSDASGRVDATPRGGAPGFVVVQDDHTLLLGDAPGNNRLDALQNLLQNPQAGLLFMIPGVDETLRVNGRVVLSVDPADLARCDDGRRPPKLVLRMQVQEAFLHCAKAFMRSRLWSEEARIARERLPTMNQMIHDQLGLDTPPEPQADMVRRYQQDL